MENINVLILFKLKTSKFKNFKDKDFIFYLRLKFFLENATKSTEVSILLELLKKIQHYNIDEVARYLISGSRLKIYNLCKLVVDEKSDHGSNNRIIAKIASYKSKNYDWKKKIAKEDTKDAVVYIDDFVGTGQTALSELSRYKFSEKKYVLTYFISKEGLELLRSHKIIVNYYKIANTVTEDKILSFCSGKSSFPNENFTLNTCISEDFTSSNNNYPYLYKKNDSWNNFLTRNNEIRFMEELIEDFIDEYGCMLTENSKHIQKKLHFLEFETKKERLDLLRYYLSGENISDKYKIDDEKIQSAYNILEKKIISMMSTIKRPNEVVKSRRS